MRALLDAQRAVGVGRLDLERRRLDAGLFGVGRVEDVDRVVVPLGPAQVHPQQHLGEVGGVDAAGLGADRDQCLARVVLDRTAGCAPRARRSPCAAPSASASASARDSASSASSASSHSTWASSSAAAQVLDPADLALDERQPGGDLLGVLGVVPQVGCGGLLLRARRPRARSVSRSRTASMLASVAESSLSSAGTSTTVEGTRAAQLSVGCDVSSWAMSCLGRDVPVGVPHDLGDLVPVGVAVDAHADPAAVPDVGRAEELRGLRDELLLRAGRRGHQKRGGRRCGDGRRGLTNCFLSRTKKDGSPWLARSVVSGRARQMRRSWATGSMGRSCRALRSGEVEQVVGGCGVGEPAQVDRAAVGVDGL